MKKPANPTKDQAGLNTTIEVRVMVKKGNIKCTRCEEEKTEDNFYNDRSKPSGKKPRCKPCDKLSRDPEKRRAYEKQYWSKRKAVKAKIVKKSAQKNKEHHKQKRREYLKTEAGKKMYRRQTQKRYALKKAAFVENVNPIELWVEQGGVCYICFYFGNIEDVIN